MSNMSREAMIRRNVTATPYDYSNERLNRLMDDETVFVVQGSLGRIPIIAGTAEEAIERYIDRHMHKAEEENILE